MSVYSGSEIETSGLVFSFDASNTQKSWKGKPITNLIQYSEAYSGGNFLSNWNGNLFGNWINSTVTTGQLAPDGSSTAEKITGYYSRWTPSMTATPGTIYTFSCWLKNDQLVNAPLLHIAFGLNGTLVSYNYITTVAISSISDWARFSVTATAPASGINQIQCGVEFGASKSANATGYSMFVWGAQCEVGSFASPYVKSLGSSGTRTNTQALLDLTNTHTHTAQSLTYNSDGTFSFDGGSNYTYLESSGFFSTGGNNFFADVGYAWSVSAWFRFPITPSGTRTGNSAWVIFGQSGGIGGAETLTIYVGSATDSSLSPSIPYYCTVGIRGAKTVISPASVNTNTWNHVVVTWNGSAGRVYFNGVDRGAATIGGAAIQTGVYASIGMTGNSGAVNTIMLYEGRIDNVSVYNRALNASEVLDYFNAFRGRFGI